MEKGRKYKHSKKPENIGFDKTGLMIKNGRPVV
jgi:hypothetical protein